MNKKLCLTLNEMRDFFDKSPIISLDTETTALRYMDLEIEGISMCNGTDAIYIPFMFRKNGVKYWELQIKEETITFLKGKIKSLNLLIMHNAPFDLKVLNKYGIKPTCELYDTMVASHLIDENSEKALKKLAKSVLGYDLTDKYEEANEDTGSKRFIDYAIMDAVYTWELAMKQKPILQANGTEKLFREVEMPFQYVLTEMAVTGIEIDQDKVKSISKNLVKEKEDTTVQMLDNLGESYSFQIDLLGNSNIVSNVNFSSPMQLANILFDKLNLPCIEQTPTGKRAVGKKTLTKYKDNDFVKLLQKYKVIDKLLSGFFTPMPEFIESDGRVRPNFKDCGTRTGRMSCVKPNLQQLPKQNEAFPVDTRSCFIAGKGKKLIVSDFSSQEVCVAAEISQDETLIKSLNNGYDVHLAVANSSFNLGIPEECLSKKHPEYSKYKKQFKKERTNAKIITFGTLYGKEAYGFAIDFEISEDEAQKMIDSFYAGMPKVRDAINKAHNEVKDNGYVTYMSGRRRNFEKIEKNGWSGYSKKALRQSFNACIQGMSADMMRMAMNKVYKEKQKHPEYECKIVATIHDEMLAVCNEKYINKCAKMVKHCMETCVKFSVPIIADTDVEDDYGACK